MRSGRFLGLRTPRTSKTKEQSPPTNGWGQSISQERQEELTATLRAWHVADADHAERKGPFDKGAARSPFDVWLTGAEVFWLAEQSGPDEFGQVPNLHLEGAPILEAHLEGAGLFQAHLETLYVNP